MNEVEGGTPLTLFASALRTLRGFGLRSSNYTGYVKRNMSVLCFILNDQNTKVVQDRDQTFRPLTRRVRVMRWKNVLPVAQVVYFLLQADVQEFSTQTTVGKTISNKSIENTLRVMLQKTAVRKGRSRKTTFNATVGKTLDLKL